LLALLPSAGIVRSSPFSPR